MKTNPGLVVVLDDDPSVLRSLSRLLSAQGYRARTHLDAEDFLRAGPPEGNACLVLDQNLGRVTGLEVHAEMRRRGWQLPTVFLTAHADTASVVAAIRGGADDYIQKPYAPLQLLASVARAIEHSEQTRKLSQSQEDLRRRVASLTRREQMVVSLILDGMLNKQIADHLNLALVTVKTHRSQAMKKLGARNAAELGSIASAAGLGRKP